MGVLIEKIIKAPLFKGLTKEEMEKVLSVAHEIKWREGDTVITEGEMGETMYIIYSGSVKVSKRLTLPQLSDERGHSEKTLIRMDAVEPIVVGEVAMLTKAERSATITATKECLVLEIYGPELAKLCEADTKIGLKIMENLAQILSERLRQTNRDVIRLSTALSVALG
jgi:CRP/FNR family transcriptional regulator, cyclic AMP receptor protein